MVKSINKQVPTDLFRLCFFFCFLFNNSYEHTQNQSKKNTHFQVDDKNFYIPLVIDLTLR